MTTALWMALAIVCEVGWALGVKVSQGFTRPLASGVTLVLYVASLVCLSQATRRMDIGTAYAIWAGLGAVLIAAAGVVWFREPLTTLRVVSVLLVGAGVAGLSVAGGGHGLPPGVRGGSHGTTTIPQASPP